LGLMSPATTSQDRGLRNKLQAAQVSPFFGRSWYAASAWDIFCGADAGRINRLNIPPDSA